MLFTSSGTGFENRGGNIGGGAFVTDCISLLLTPRANNCSCVRDVAGRPRLPIVFEIGNKYNKRI